ncbi:hypothetical protein M413DRAFT_447591 [Hebeloma cylindrosporum]|uniref:Uncharacterized protein n=1 Tax=Hebeloma cylindrosporum TaxID=76867 RepID=A0A0C2XMJ4_HEBCY|nr:hypothetical protein M413DRAFT_447591 [Hebeloma cylindrosporum h7]
MSDSEQLGATTPPRYWISLSTPSILFEVSASSKNPSRHGLRPISLTPTYYIGGMVFKLKEWGTFTPLSTLNGFRTKIFWRREENCRPVTRT